MPYKPYEQSGRENNLKINKEFHLYFILLKINIIKKVYQLLLKRFYYLKIN